MPTIQKTKRSSSCLLTREEAAAELLVGLRTLDKLVANGDLPVVRIGSAVRVQRTAIADLIEARASRSNPKQKGGRK